MLVFHRFKARTSYDRAVQECEQATEALRKLNDEATAKLNGLSLHLFEFNLPGAGKRLAKRMRASS